MGNPDLSFATIHKRLIAERIHSWTREHELGELYRFVRSACRLASPLIVELGTAEGASAIVMAQSLKACGRPTKILTVDNGRYCNLDVPRANFENAGLSDMIELIESDDIEYLKSCAPSSIDLIYIDSWHRYKHVAETLRIATDKVADSGIISGHDYSPVQCGVIRAVDEWRSERANDLLGWGLHTTLWWTIKRPSYEHKAWAME